MAGLVDHERVLLDVEAYVESRPSHGAPQLRAEIARLRQTHRVHETTDAAVLRRFASHLTDTFLGLLPRAEHAAHAVPLPPTDPSGTVGAMSDDAAHPMTTNGGSHDGQRIHHQRQLVRPA